MEMFSSLFFTQRHYPLLGSYLINQIVNSKGEYNQYTLIYIHQYDIENYFTQTQNYRNTYNKLITTW